MTHEDVLGAPHYGVPSFAVQTRQPAAVPPGPLGISHGHSVQHEFFDKDRAFQLDQFVDVSG